MVFVIFFALVGLIWGLVYYRKDVDYVVLSCIVGGGVGFVISFFVGMFIVGCYAPPRERTEIGRVELLTLRNINATEGRFFLGSGGIGDAQYYSYYWKVDENGYRPERMAFDESITVYEDTSNHPYLAVYKNLIPPNRYYKLIPWVFFFRDLGPNEESTFEFHIPPGTLKNNFVLN